MNTVCFRITLPVLALVALVLIFAALHAAATPAQTEGTPPPLPEPGKLIDIGGWRLHLNCAGEPRATQPTVILESGVGDFSVEWSLVQPGVSTFARVCSYDRAGDGWSDLGPHPRKLVRSSELSRGLPIPPVKVSGPLRISNIPPAALTQMKAGLAEASATANEPPRDKLPPDARRMRTWALGQLGHVAAAVNPFEHEELAALRAERARTQYPLGDMPLIVLTRGLPERDDPDARALEEEHKQDHAALAAMSRNGKQVIATRSGHHIQIDEPGLVINSIRQVLASLHK